MHGDFFWRIGQNAGCNMTQSPMNTGIETNSNPAYRSNCVVFSLYLVSMGQIAW